MGVVFLELNEATSYFVDKFSRAGKLPRFARILAEGAALKTHIPDVISTDPRFTRNTSPWIVWPSVYTGMRAAAHELVGFGQNTDHVAGKYVWDVLDQAGRSYGVFGSLISWPPRPGARFYVPESLANSPDCIPSSLRSLQEFFLFGAHHYSESDFGAFRRAASDFVRACKNALSLPAAMRAFSQIPREIIGGGPAKSDRAMLHSILTYDAFSRLYRDTRPEFATVHFNHIAYMQHRYWRAAETDRFARELSSTDRRFYKSVAERERDESAYADKIERAYVWTDGTIGHIESMLSNGDYLVIASGLSQRPYDPVSEIHNPVVRFDNAERFFSRLGLSNIVIRHEMNPDLTIDCASASDAANYEALILGLRWDDDSSVFYCQRRRHQLFLELIVPATVEHNPNPTIRHATQAAFAEAARDHVWQSEINEQSTAHHDEQGMLLIWRKGSTVAVSRNDILVTEIAPLLLELCGLDAQSWHRDYRGPLLASKARPA